MVLGIETWAWYLAGAVRYAAAEVCWYDADPGWYEADPLATIEYVGGS